jgi:hypothetical protein
MLSGCFTGDNTQALKRGFTSGFDGTPEDDALIRTKSIEA